MLDGVWFVFIGPNNAPVSEPHSGTLITLNLKIHSLVRLVIEKLTFRALVLRQSDSFS